MCCRRKLSFILTFSSLLSFSDGQAAFGNIDKTTALKTGILSLGTDAEEEDDIFAIATDDSDESHEVDYTDDVLVIPNEFPEKLTRICYPRTRLQRDRYCIGSIDSYALACAAGRPPLQLVPFCTGFDDLCKDIDFPEEEWCEKDYSLYSRHCAYEGRKVCRVCKFEDCSCEPYDCIVKKKGVRTAEWCQRYELFCNATARRDDAERLISLLETSVRIHDLCYVLFNLANTICNPFKAKYDFKRCQKFLLDCELISDFAEEDQQEAFRAQADLAILQQERGKNEKGKEGEKKKIKEKAKGTPINEF